MSSSKKHYNGSRRNFWTPLQLLDENDKDDENDMDCQKNEQSKREKISPIKVLTQNKESILKLLNDKSGTTNYLIKKISLGFKIITETIEVFDQIVKILIDNKCQFFIHDHKTNKPFKAVLRGLDGKTDVEVKNTLNNLQLKCVDVKVVKKSFNNYIDTIYIVSFENGSVKLHELRKNVRVLFQTIVTWCYQRKIKNKPVQCRKCQMFGHGEKGCNVAERCAICAEKHKTADCKATNKIKCANCGNDHKATDPLCSNRSEYLKMREQFSNKKTRQPSHTRRNYNINDDYFPNLTNKQNSLPTVPNWKPLNLYSCGDHNNSYLQCDVTSPIKNISNENCQQDLFSEQEFMNLTIEMISKLRACKSREQQFTVITQLAFKFVYCNVK